MSSDDPQNTEQPGEFEDLENENAPNQDPEPAATPPEPASTPAPTPVPASPQPEPTKLDPKDTEIADLRAKNEELKISARIACKERDGATREHHTARAERDRARRNMKILVVLIIALLVSVLCLAAHDFLLETGPKTSTTIPQPATSGTKSQYDFSKDDFTAELKALRKFEPEEAGTEK